MSGQGGTTTSVPDPTSQIEMDCRFSEIEGVNVIVFNDAKPTGADCEGRMWVGGNLTTSNYAIATTNMGSATTTCTEYGLVVGGDIVGAAIVREGKISLGGLSSGDSEANCGFFHGTSVDFPALQKKLCGYSAALQAYPTNGTATVNYSKLVLTGDDSELNVFSVAAEQLSSITETQITVPVTSSVIVNINGMTINWQSGFFTLPDGGNSCKANTSSFCTRIVYNMYEATSVSINGIGFQGSILAPYATFNGKGGNVDGQVIVRNLNGITEYHPYFFDGCMKLPSGWN